jgi:hypothetical protein
MPAVSIPRERWAEFLDAFSRQHRAWLAAIEPPIRGAHARPLRALEPVRQGGIIAAIDISFAGSSDGDTVRVDHPVALWLHQTAEGADLTIEITDDEGVCTRLGFRTTTAASNMLDGIAPGELIDSDAPGKKM